MPGKERKATGQPTSLISRKAKTLNKISVNRIRPGSVYFTNSWFHSTFENQSMPINNKGEKSYDHLHRCRKTLGKTKINVDI